MMKVLGAIAVSALLCCGSAHAALVVQEDGVVYDDVNNQYWIQDLSMFNSMTYSEQIAGIAALSESAFATYGEWHMATADDIANLFTYTAIEIYDAFEPALTNNRYYPGTTWIGTEEVFYGRYDEVSSTGRHRRTDMLIQYDTSGTASYVRGKQLNTITDSSYGSNIGAWAVVNANAVPVPAAAWLLGAGVLGLVGIRRRKGV